MTDTGSAIATRDHDTIQLLLDLESAGAVDDVSLVLTDVDMPYERWEAIGRFLGSLERRTNWYLGDWLNFGEAVYGEAASQGVEATTKERYSEAERVTGLAHGTLLNLSSVCRKIARSRRRSELPFSTHVEVAALDPDDQTMWLQQCIDEGWTKAQLRQAIRGLPTEPEPDPEPTHSEPRGLSKTEQIEAAARVVFATAQPTPDGDTLVPAESWSQLAAALDEDE